ncbi:hypothetical protein RHSIM_Rhsim06G0195900 [Rhododendron simsii]|uniref:Vacuolar protein sorting-associated protein Ist1 n=1 Tax=Rhododendron simsii TaxID=118357 RepID=A0A834GQT4_RHOSS|nr:hypothetical protein RHSIM_Rhsim06G0195900 [Rhododendron simsii]
MVMFISKSLINRARSQLLIQKNRREAITRQSRADIAQLLMYGQHDDALARVDQLHNDQCILSAYNQIDIYYEMVHANLREIDSRSKLSHEVVEAVSSLVFAASRCGELPELNRIRSLFRKHFGNEFERVNVELQPGNFVNSQIKYNLGNNSVSDDVKLQMTSEIARECTVCLQPDQISQENFVPQYESLDSRIGDVRDCNGKHQRQASIIKDMVWRIGSKISKSGSRNLIPKRCDPNDISSEGSPPIQDTLTVYLDDDSEDESSRTEDVNGRNVAMGLGSQNRTVSSKGNNNVKKNLAQRRGASIKTDAAYGQHDGSLYKNQMSDQTMLIKEGLPRCKTYNGRRLERNEDLKPRLSYVHPKLPDYDELVATFTEYKEEYMKSNSNDRTLSKWMRLF